MPSKWCTLRYDCCQDRNSNLIPPCGVFRRVCALAARCSTCALTTAQQMLASQTSAGMPNTKSVEGSLGKMWRVTVSLSLNNPAWESITICGEIGSLVSVKPRSSSYLGDNLSFPRRGCGRSLCSIRAAASRIGGWRSPFHADHPSRLRQRCTCSQCG